MHPTLVIGLGNTLAGDDGVGVRVVEALAREPDLEADFLVAGNDVLGAAEAMAGRRRVVMVDAIAGEPGDGSIEAYDEPFEGIDTRTTGMHALSAAGCVALLKAAGGGMEDVEFTLLAIVVDGARLHDGLSEGMASRLPRVIDAVRDYLRGG